MEPVGALKQRADQLKINLYAIYLAYKDPRVPWYARVFAACVVGYAFSPIDLVPDFIPVLGYLDDVILIPLGVAATLKMIPPDVLAECRLKAQSAIATGKGKPKNWVAAAVIIAIWLLLAALAVVFAVRLVR